MSNEEEKLYQLIRSGSIENIELALSIAQSNKIELSDYYELYAWLRKLGKIRLCKGDKDLIQAINHLDTIRYTHQKLDTIPNSFRHLGGLKHLWFYSNSIQTLPETIGELKSLEKMLLHFNHLSTLPKSIGQLPNLKELWLNHNCLTALPETIGNLSNLEDLWLNNNKLTHLPKSIYKLTQLKRMWIRHNKLDPKEIALLKAKLPNCEIK